jgi:hypothetical protein
MIRGAHVHVKWLKTLEVRPRTWSALKHVNPRTGSSASPLHAPSASSSPISNHSRTQPGGGVVQYRKFHSTDFRTNDSNFRWGVPERSDRFHTTQRFGCSSTKARRGMQGDQQRTRPRHTAVRERAAAASAQPGAPSYLACLASFRIALRILCLSLCSPSCGKGHPGY